MITLTALNGSGHLHEPADHHRNQYDDPFNVDPCSHCGGPRVRGRAGLGRCNLGLCSTCYTRWMDNGYPAGGPPQRRPGGRGWRLNDPGLLAEFAELDRCGTPGRSAELAQRFGVTRRTLSRWRRVIERRAHTRELRANAITDAGPVLVRRRASQRGEYEPDAIIIMAAAEAVAGQTGGARRVDCVSA